MPEWDGIKMEEEKMRSKKLADGGPKSRIHWSFCDMEQDEWDSIFKKEKDIESEA
jgi:hypothetical protein